MGNPPSSINHRLWRVAAASVANPWQESNGTPRSHEIPAGQRGAPSGVGLESASGWEVAASSPRKASLHWVASGGDRQALGIALGEGRGDRIEIIRPVRVTSDLKSVSVEVKPQFQEEDHLAVGVVLTSTTERPWLKRGPEQAEPNAWTTVTFDFGDVEERKLGRVDRLMIALHTDADAGFCLVRNIVLLA